ncbi:MAG: ThuA domain-containing protein [Planctomycetota bacterium]|nr:ThuA domain-containing protein [Planctomycetota bacterium]MDA0969079.1 ThuA domain-containing protein [Planctomycetota bacterium]
MPLYEYACQHCDEKFELLIRGQEKPACPHCKGKKLTRLLSVVSGHVADGSSGGGGEMPEGGCGMPQCGMGGCGMGGMDMGGLGGMLALLLAVFLSWAGTAIAAEPPARLLVVTVTNGFRHKSIETAEPVIEQLGRESGLFHVDYLRQPAGEEVFARAFAPEALAEFDGVIFASTTGELPIPDVDAFLSWIKKGKAFIGIHAASDTFKSNDAYVEMIGGHFAGHPWNAGGEHAFVVHEPGHPLAAMVPERFRWKDEIYQYDLRYNPDNLRVLVSLDMTASSPKEPWHVPVSWVRSYGDGRVFYTNFGHNDATWQEPAYQQHLIEGIRWALGRSEAPAEPNPEVQAAEYLRSVVAAAAEATERNADDLLAKADARIAKDPSFAVGLRPRMLELRGMEAAARKDAYAAILAELEGGL